MPPGDSNGGVPKSSSLVFDREPPLDCGLSNPLALVQPITFLSVVAFGQNHPQAKVIMHLEDAPKLIQPRDHKAKVLVWGDLTVSDMDTLNENTTPDQIKIALSQMCNICTTEDNPRNDILLDLYFYTIQFARENKFSNEQTSAFFSIIKTTHKIATETPFGNVEHCFRYFKEAVLCHAIRRPPFSIDLFNEADVRKIMDYTINTYFRHIKMYKYAFTPLVRLDLSISYDGIPPSPTPSESGEAEAEDTVENAEDNDAKEGEQEEKAENVEGETEVGATESPAAAELRKLIKSHLEEEIEALKVSVEDQIKHTEDTLNQKLEAVEEAGGGGKAGGKAKKK